MTGPNSPMRVYLASRYSRREELAGYAEELRRLGIEVTSRWLEGNHQVSDAGLSEEAHAAERTRFACEDWEDLMRAQVTISFTEDPRGTNSRGGRHVEFGAALAIGQMCFICGPAENVFHCLPDSLFAIERCETWPETFNALLAHRSMWEIADRVTAAILTVEMQSPSPPYARTEKVQ